MIKYCICVSDVRGEGVSNKNCLGIIFRLNNKTLFIHSKDINICDRYNRIIKSVKAYQMLALIFCASEEQYTMYS